MTPNQITCLRVALALVAIGMFRFGFWWAALAVVLTAVAIALDGLDGYVARRTGTSSPLGAALDIVGDRIIEDSYLIFFAAAGLISFWVPVLFIVRGAVTDFLRAIGGNRRSDGPGGLLRTWWGRALVGSRWSRAAYGTLKAVLFCHLGAMLLLRRGSPFEVSEAVAAAVEPIGVVLTYATVGFCLVRGAPVLWEARSFVSESGA